MRLKILSWNIWVDGHFDKISDFLKRSDADVIGLQEVKDNDPERDIISYLRSLGYRYAYAENYSTWVGKMGPAIFSKHDIQGARTYMLSEKNRVAVRADISMGDKTLHVFSTHLIHTHQEPSKEQEEQAARLLEVLPRRNTIVMGDFNATPDSVAIKKMKEVFYDPGLPSALTWSVYPEGCNVCKPRGVTTRLDYIFVSRDLRISDFKVEDSKGSDHLPISAILDI